ncbi:hypothetical protein DL98DRAFT_212435 [Cadophora sp. DSE1049]|nr:hypothetical protein DL98DRAFT_212435 [Cadophora sp. DSE1049]
MCKLRRIKSLWIQVGGQISPTCLATPKLDHQAKETMLRRTCGRGWDTDSEFPSSFEVKRQNLVGCVLEDYLETQGANTKLEMASITVAPPCDNHVHVYISHKFSPLQSYRSPHISCHSSSSRATKVTPGYMPSSQFSYESRSFFSSTGFCANISAPFLTMQDLEFWQRFGRSLAVRGRDCWSIVMIIGRVVFSQENNGVNCPPL